MSNDTERTLRKTGVQRIEGGLVLTWRSVVGASALITLVASAAGAFVRVIDKSEKIETAVQRDEFLDSTRAATQRTNDRLTADEQRLTAVEQRNFDQDTTMIRLGHQILAILCHNNGNPVDFCSDINRRTVGRR